MKSTAWAYVASLGAPRSSIKAYTTRETVLDVGPIQATKEMTKTVPLPPLLGGMALLRGVVLLGAKRT